MKKLAILALPLIVAACAGGGGGGGGSASTSPAANFTNWSALGPNSTITAAGSSTQLSYTQSGDTVSPSSGTQSATGASVTVGLNAAGDLSTFALQSGQGASFTLDRAKGDSFNDFTVNGIPVSYLQSKNGQNEATLSNGFEYQGFGVWATGIGTGSGNAGAVSVGSVTPATNIPTTGSATFSGTTIGTLTVNGIPDNFVASSTSKVDFAARTIAYSTAGTTILGTGGASAAGLNMSGLFVYNAGSNQFSGAVATGNGAFKGSALGNFYGPNANELGGTYNMTGASGVMFGGFGGKR